MQQYMLSKSNDKQRALPHNTALCLLVLPAEKSGLGGSSHFYRSLRATADVSGLVLGVSIGLRADLAQVRSGSVASLPF